MANLMAPLFLFCFAAVHSISIYKASEFRTLKKTVENGKLYDIKAPDETRILELHIYGSAYERGLAQGQLLGETISDFMVDGLNDYFKAEVDQIPLGKLPKWIQDKIKALGKDLAPEAFHLALEYVYLRQEKFIRETQGHVFDETDGIAVGMCQVANQTISMCKDVNQAKRYVRVMNMLPELVRMQCSMMGAWGDATVDGKLVQMRTLDFGGGPFANNSVVIVHHPTDTNIAYASLGFPGVVGVVTGLSEKIAQCEKVDDLAGGGNPKGSYAGVADVFVIRDMLQHASTKEEALAIAQNAKRTWGVWLGIGDYSSQEFLAMDYQQAHATAYDDKSLPSRTNQSGFKNVAYIDKHPQPSVHPELPNLVKKFYGNITAPNVVKNFPLQTQSGDVHIAIYDLGQNNVFFSTGITDASGTNYIRKAYESPFLQFDIESLWSESKP
mmetsp:Transcript_22885/g.38330  ORF Transcript_22885/g.38330 Transcript_22885/m.38330 type:complete len:441 (+) Transcript_22885:3-1325(+)